MFKLLDVVTLRHALPEYGLAVGDAGTVVESFGNPPAAYLVEFCNGDGETLAMPTLPPEELAPA